MIGAIKVGDHVYPAGAVLHVLVLDRRTLAPISNTGYNSHEDERLHADIAKLDDSELVIVSVAGSLAQSNPRARLPIDELLNRIGVPGQLCGSTDNCVPLPGQYSAIGVPGMKVGDGDWNNRTNVEHPTAGLNGGLQGYLSPDQYLNYGFVPAEREPFTYGGKEVAPCASGTICEPTHLGYRLERPGRTHARARGRRLPDLRYGRVRHDRRPADRRGGPDDRRLEGGAGRRPDHDSGRQQPRAR